MNRCKHCGCDKDIFLDEIKRLREALVEIRQMAKNHSCFDGEFFERRDIDGLCAEGGDIADWTFLAIVADDALDPQLRMVDKTPTKPHPLPR